MAERQDGLQEPHGTCHNHDSQKCGHDVASVSMHTGLIGLKPNPTKGRYEYATAWKGCGDEVVHQLVEDDAAPSKLVRSQGECAIGLVEECHQASVWPHGAHDQPAARAQGPYSMGCASPTCAKGVLPKGYSQRGTPKDKGSPLKRTATLKPGRSLFRIRARGLTAACRFWQRNDLWRRPAGQHPGLAARRGPSPHERATNNWLGIGGFGR